MAGISPLQEFDHIPNSFTHFTYDFGRHVVAGELHSIPPKIFLPRRRSGQPGRVRSLGSWVTVTLQ